MSKHLLAAQSQPPPWSGGAGWAYTACAGALDDRLPVDDTEYYRARAAAGTACADAAMHPKARAAHLELALAYQRLASGTALA